MVSESEPSTGSFSSGFVASSSVTGGLERFCWDVVEPMVVVVVGDIVVVIEVVVSIDATVLVDNFGSTTSISSGFGDTFKTSEPSEVRLTISSTPSSSWSFSRLFSSKVSGRGHSVRLEGKHDDDLS